MNQSKNGFFLARYFRDLNLRFKFILTFLAVALIPLGLVAFFNNRATQARLTEEANQALFTAASQTAASLDAFVNTNLNTIRTESELPLWAEYLKLPAEQRAGSDLEPEVRSTVRALSRKTNISSYALLDFEGRTVMDTFASNIGLIKSDRDYFQQPLKTGLPYVSPVIFSPTTGKPSIYFSSPVRNPARNIVGVLRIRYGADVLQSIVARSNGLAGPDSFAVLFDENYIYLANGLAPETILQTVAPLEPAQIAALQSAGRLPNLPAEELMTELPGFEQNLSNAAIQPFFTVANIAANNKVNQAAVSNMEIQPWLVVFLQPQEVFLAPVRAQTRSALLLATLIAGIVVMVAAGMGQLLSRPITRLTAVAQQVTDGNLDTQAVVESRDEIGQLATAFNRMTSQLKETIDSLNLRILEQQRTQEALQTSEATNRALLEAIPDMIFQFDRDGTFLTYIPAQALQTFLPPEEFLGKTIEEVLPPDLARQTRHHLEQLWMTGEGQVFVYSLPVDGNPRYFEARQVKGGENNIFAIVRDITDRVHAQVERENLIAELEAKNAELERFAYTVSHDLKAPLVTIRGFLGYLREDAVSGKMERLENDIHRITQSTDRMQVLLHDLLELSRIGRLMNEPETIPFADLVRDAMDNVHGQLEAGRITVQTQPNLPAVYGDRQRLVDVLQNLLDNAAKFMEAQPEPCIEIGQRGDEDGKPVFYIKDNGIGIPPQYHEQIFGLFNKLNPNSDGTGIGLALVKRIIEFHGGRIWVESEEGKGSTFYFTLGKVDAK